MEKRAWNTRVKISNECSSVASSPFIAAIGNVNARRVKEISYDTPLWPAVATLALAFGRALCNTAPSHLQRA